MYKTKDALDEMLDLATELEDTGDTLREPPTTDSSHYIGQGYVNAAKRIRSRVNQIKRAEGLKDG